MFKGYRRTGQKKYDPLFKERANNAIKKIRKIEQEGGHIKKDIVLEIYNEDRLNSEDSSDKIIVLQALDYISKHPDEDICIMTEDLGMHLRCRQRVNTIDPDKTKRQESPKSELQKKNIKLKTELTRLRNKIPILNLIVTQPNSDKINPPEQFRAKYYSVILAKENMANDEYEAIVTAIRSEPLISPFLVGSHSEYQTSLVNYLKQYNTTIKELSKSFPFTLRIENTGRIPAENISINLKFQKIFQFIACGQKYYGTIPDIPQKPRPLIDCSVTQRMPIFADLKSINQYYNFHAAINIPDGTQIEFSDDENNIIMHIKIKQILHYDNVTLDCIAGVISPEKANNFQLEYEIFAENMPEKKESEIPFVFTKENT